MQHPPRWPYRDMRAPAVPTPPAPPAYTPPSDPLLVYNPERPAPRPFVGLRACFLLDAEYDEEL